MAKLIGRKVKYVGPSRFVRERVKGVVLYIDALGSNGIIAVDSSYDVLTSRYFLVQEVRYLNNRRVVL